MSKEMNVPGCNERGSMGVIFRPGLTVAAVLLASMQLSAAPPEPTKSDSREVRVAQNEDYDRQREEARAEREVARAERAAEREVRRELRTKQRATSRAASKAWKRAYSFHRDDDFEQATKAFEESYEAGYRKATSAYNAACGYARLNQLGTAMDWLERSMEAGFDVGEYLWVDDDLINLRSDPAFESLREEYPSRKRDRLLRKYERRIERDDVDGESFYGLGMSLHVMGEYDKAIRAWERTLASGNNTSSASYNIACARARLGQHDDALDALDRAIELGYTNVQHMERDDDLDSIRDDARFAALLGKAEDLDLPSTGRNGHHGWFQRPAWDAAAERYQSYVEENPDSPRGWFNLGFASLQVDQPVEAAAAFERAHELGYDKSTSAYNVACSYARANDADQAFEWLDKARDAGFDSMGLLASDSDLDNIRSDSRFPDVEKFRGGNWRRFIEHFIDLGDEIDVHFDHDDDDDDDDWGDEY